MFREIWREALYGIARNRLRAGLSMLGISWGIVSVVVLLAYGNGFHRAIGAGFAGAFSDCSQAVERMEETDCWTLANA